MGPRISTNLLRLLRRAHSTDAALGLRSALPPDTPPSPHPSARPPPISDAEWELRTGRGILVLTQTLPTFFATGLVPHSDAGEPIYSPAVRLAYTPPAPLPAPLPKTLHIEGWQMYLASSVFVRHALNALYADLAVALDKVAVAPATPTSKSRDKSLFVGLTATGRARVSGAPGEWEVNSTYTFSPLTGLIHIHTVNSIHPAPHHAVYDALRASLGLGPGPVFGPNEPGRPGAASATKMNPKGDARPAS
ncbi:hypothetical protein B0H17DRAFT_1099536 [Mycena rosella]|uniref:Uncharacterized protein n=1 Tax=Mycena rosella TaxID=1033263 RepID=A0AAD7G3B4_MYCRO|nr:hypothetical protein B0H17DRAFT_1099536 [Mycena rosella]